MMQIAIEKKEGAEVRFKVEIPQERVAEELSQAFRRVVKDVKVDGFRKGKVPRRIFERRFGEGVIQEEAIRKIYPEIYQKIVNEHKLTPIIEPSLEIVQFSADKSLILKVDLMNKPEVKLGRYKEIKVARKKMEVSSDEIQKALEELQRQHTRYVPLQEKREIRENDWVVMDYQVFHEGRLVPEKRQENFLFKVGSTYFPPSFSQGLIGLKAGEEKDVKVEIPSSYSREEFRGKEFTFKITLKEIREEKVPSLDNEFAKNLKFDDLKSFRNHIKSELQKAKENWEEKRLRGEIVDRVVKNSQIEIPPSLVKRRAEERVKQLENRLKENGTNLQDYLKRQKLSEDKLRERFSEELEEEISTFFILGEIAEREGIEVKEEEISKSLEKSVNRELKEEELEKIKNNLAVRGELNILAARIREKKAVDLLYEKAKIGQ